MLDAIIDNLKLDKYIVNYTTGQTIFLEGDDSQDLYIIVEGTAAILKGANTIADISGKGSVFGEMSFLLGENRTATVKAATDLKLIKIPKEEIKDFLDEFPEVVQEFARYLAKRLDETSQILFGLRQFCDQLPDAVLLTNRDGKILAWNRAAENLYGREEDQLRHTFVEDIYENPDECKRFLEEVTSQHAVREKTLKIRHPKDGIRYISTSTTILYDGQHNFRGILSLGRDVTQTEAVAKRYRRVRKWLVPLSVLLLISGVGIFLGYPYFSKGYHIPDAHKQDLKEDLAFHFRLLRSMLTELLSAGDRQKTTEVMRNFFDAQKGADIPFMGIALLGKDKRVFDAYSPLPGVSGNEMIGNSYSGIDLGEKEDAFYKVLTLYREHKDYPMGLQLTEIAFRLYDEDVFKGWLIFQVDRDILMKKYDANEKDLKTFRFDHLIKDAN